MDVFFKKYVFDFIRGISLFAYESIQGPRNKQKSLGSQILKLTPKYLKFAFYCIFSIQFLKLVGSWDPTDPMVTRSLSLSEQTSQKRSQSAACCSISIFSQIKNTTKLNFSQIEIQNPKIDNSLSLPFWTRIMKDHTLVI